MIKIFGAILGFSLLGFLGIFIGWFAGSALERYLQYGSGGVNPFTAQQRQQTFIKSLFQLAGSIAKADGRVSQDEINHVEQLMAQMGMNQSSRQQSINYFREGAQTQFDIDGCLQEFIRVCGSTRHLRQTLITYLVSLAYSDGTLDANERNVLERIANALGIGRMQFDAFMRMYENQQRFSGSYSHSSYSGSTHTNSQTQLNDAYAALGVQPSATDKDIKKAYRKLMSQYHPDKLMGQGVPEDMLKVATEKSKEIQAAYDLIKKHRG